MVCVWEGGGMKVGFGAGKKGRKNGDGSMERLKFELFFK